METAKKFDVAALRFQSEAATIALEHCKANLAVPEANGYLEKLWEEYNSEGKPTDRAGWLRPRLERMFPCSSDRPAWVGETQSPQWPWFNGIPMLFVGQMESPSASLPTGHVVHNRIIFVFCAAGPALVQTPNGWTIQYTVIDQELDIP